MPMRAYRASTAYAGGHVRENFGLWLAGAAAATAILALAVWAFGGRGILGDLFTLAALVLGIFVMLKSQQGYVAPNAGDDDEEPELSDERAKP